MCVVGGRGSAFGAIVEHHQLWIAFEQLVNLAVGLTNELRLVLHAGNGEVNGQDGVGVDEQVVLTVDALFELLLGTVLLTEETGPLSQSLLVDAGTCRNDAGWVPLHQDRRGTNYQLASLHIPQVVVSASGIFPFLQLAVEESQQG